MPLLPLLDGANPLSLTATVEPTSKPQIRLTAAARVTGSQSVPTNTLLSVTRTHLDGTVHKVLTGRAPRMVSGAWVWLDVHCPFNQLVKYTITSGGYSATATVTLPSTSAWLSHPEDASLAVKVLAVREVSDLTTASRSGRFTPIGGKTIHLSDGMRDSLTGTLSLRCLPTDVPTFNALFDADTVILINTPNTAGWDLDWLWVQPGAVARVNPANQIRYPYRYITMPFEETADPDFDLSPEWTAGDFAAYWTSVGVYAGGVPALYGHAIDTVTDTRL